MLGETRHNESAWHARVRFALLIFAVIGAFFLIAEHRAHVLPWLPWVFLAVLLLMHAFMYRAHGGHAGPGNTGPGGSSPPSP